MLIDNCLLPDKSYAMT